MEKRERRPLEREKERNEEERKDILQQQQETICKVEEKEVRGAKLGNLYQEILKVFTKDAEFGFLNGKKHHEERLKNKEIPETMSFEDYLRKAKEVSLKPINGSTVRAYRYRRNRIGKSDGSWFVSYVGGIGGTLVTAAPLIVTGKQIGRAHV